jgi:hypothetical protein
MSLKSRLGKQPIFLLEIDYSGQIFRLASDACNVPSNEGLLSYTGGLRQFDFSESMDIFSFDPESNNLSCAIDLDGIDLLFQMAAGNTIEGAKAEFSYVVYDRSIVDNYENRIILLNGIIQQPQYGDPLESDNFLSVSISSEPFDRSRLILEPRLKIDQRFANRDIDSADGKNWPIILGDPGSIIQADGTSTEVYSVPAYCISSNSSDIRAMLSAGKITATTAKIRDELGQTVTKSVITTIDSNGDAFSYIPIANSDTIAFPGTTINPTETSNEWFCSLDGGIESPYQSGSLSGGGDICRWALSKTAQEIDDRACANLSGILNRYEFAGFINDGSISAWEWLSGNIIPYLPITVITGPQGIKPVLIQLWAIHLVNPVAIASIGIAQDWLQISAVETLQATSDLVNKSVVHYATKGFDDDTSQQIVCTAFPQNDEIGSDYAVVSQNRYGLQEASTQADYVYSNNTATRIALDMVRSSALPIRAFSVVAGFEWGWLELGDVVEITNSRLHLFSHRMLVISKVWTGEAFQFKLIYEDSHITNPRP